MPYHGRLYVSQNYVCFHCSMLLKDVKVRPAGLAAVQGSLTPCSAQWLLAPVSSVSHMGKVCVCVGGVVWGECATVGSSDSKEWRIMLWGRWHFV